MSEFLSPPSPERDPRVEWHSGHLLSRLTAIAALVLSVAGCAASPEPAPAPRPGRAASGLGDGGWVSLEPDRVAPSSLSVAEVQAEQTAFRLVFHEGKAIRRHVMRIAEIQEALKTAEGNAQEALSQELAQASFDLEVKAFNLFGDIRRTNPRCWARLLRVLRAVTDGTVRVENIEGLELEQFGEIETTPDTTVSRKAMLGLYAEQVKFLALMVARVDRSLAGLREQFDGADPAERENLQGMIHTLEKQQSDLMGLIEVGDIFPVVPTEAERAAWQQRIFEVFREVRQQAGGRDGLPSGIRFGESSPPPSDQLQQVAPVRPSESHPQPAAPAPAPNPPSPEREQERRVPRPDYSPRVV